MGGRGSSSGAGGGGGGGSFGGYGSLSGLLQAGAQNASKFSAVNTDPNKQGDWDDGGNPNVQKYQGQEEDKLARYLAKVWNQVDLNDQKYSDGWGYYNNSLQKLSLDLGMDKPATVLSESDFNAYVKQTGAEVKYRGMSGSDAADRFMDASHNHVGNGVYGDGHYFTNRFQTAADYGAHAARQKGNPGSSRVVVKMALSPTARVIDYHTLRTAMSYAGVKLRNGLQKAGTQGTRTYGGNDGEAQFALKLGYNVIRVSGGSDSFEYALTRDAFVVSKKRL